MSSPTSSAVPDDHVVVGRIGKPFGMNGDVYVFADPDLSERFAPDSVYDTLGRRQPLTVNRSRLHSAKLVVGFAGVHDRQGAEDLRNVVLIRARSEVHLAAEAVWIAELIGRAVVDPSGMALGVVTAVLDGHAHDYLNVQTEEGTQVMIPMVGELVDWQADPIVVQPLPGLLDLNEAL